MGDLQGAYAKSAEFIIFATKGRHILNGKRDTDVLHYKRVPSTQLQHQNQKPLKLIMYLISKSSNRGETVFDCFMGSGTTCLAAKKLHRNYIGIEIDKTYYNIAKRRIGQ